MSTQNLDIPSILLEEVSKRRATLFLGAGASGEVGFPDANELSAHLVKKAANINSLEGKSLDEVADYLYLERGYGESWVR